MRMERKKYDRGDKSSLTARKITLLTDMGFVWARDRGVAWEEKFHELESFKAEHGHCIVPTKSSDSIELQRLGRWVSRQRELYKVASTDRVWQERKERLETLGFQWCATNVTPHS